MSAVRRRPLAAIAIAGALAALTGCGSDPPPPPCPRVLIVDDAAQLTAFAAGPGRDFVDVDHDAEIADLKSGCRYEKGDAGEKALIAVAPVIVATRGPANTDRAATVTYFVSVVDASDAILNKQLFEVPVRFEGNQRRITWIDDTPPVIITLPVDSPAAAATTYEVLVGFQLSPDQLDYNRRRRNVRP